MGKTEPYIVVVLCEAASDSPTHEPQHREGVVLVHADLYARHLRDFTAYRQFGPLLSGDALGES